MSREDYRKLEVCTPTWKPRDLRHRTDRNKSCDSQSTDSTVLGSLVDQAVKYKPVGSSKYNPGPGRPREARQTRGGLRSLVPRLFVDAGRNKLHMCQYEQGF